MSSRVTIDTIVEDAVEKLEGFVEFLDLAYDYVTAGVRGTGTARKMLKQYKENRLLSKKSDVRDAVRKALNDYIRAHPRYTTDELKKVAYDALVNVVIDDLDFIAYIIAQDISKFRLDAGVLKGRLEEFINPLIPPFIEALDKRLEEMGKAPPTAPPTAPAPAPTPAPVAPPRPAPLRPRRERKSLVERIVEELQEATLPTNWQYIIPPPPDREDEWRDWLESEIRITKHVPLCLRASLIYPYFPWFTFADTGRKVPLVYTGNEIYDFLTKCHISGYRDTQFTENYCAVLAPEYYNPSMLRSFCDLMFPVLDPNDMDTLYIESATELKRIVKGILQINAVTENLCKNFLASFAGITVEECIDKLWVDETLLDQLNAVMSSIDKQMDKEDADHPYSIPEVERILSTTIMSQILKPSFHEAEKDVSHSFFTPFGNATQVPGRALMFLRSLRIIVEIYKRYKTLNSNEARTELISLYPCETYVYYSPTLNTNLYFTVWDGTCNFDKIKQYMRSLFGLMT
jgi:hypothetical protein